MLEYTQGKTDDMAYRVARRDAHNADAALSSTLTNMLKEPGYFRKQTDIGFRFLLLSHTLLSYISALGAHREKLAHAPTYLMLNQEAQLLADSLEDIAQKLIKREPIAVHSDPEQKLSYRLADLPEEEDDTLRLLQTQLLLISQQLGSIRTLAAHVLSKT